MKTIDCMRIYLGGEHGIKPMVEVVFMVDGVRQSSINLSWDEPKIREKEVLPFLNAYTLIYDTRVLR